MKVDKAVVAGHLCNLLPPRLQKAVLADDTFIWNYGPIAQTIITLGDISIGQTEIFEVIRQALRSRTQQETYDVHGRKVLVSLRDGAPTVGIAGEEPLLLQELMALSPIPEDRLRAIDLVLRHLGPTASTLAYLRLEAAHRELTNDEAELLLEELAYGFRSHRRQLRAAITAKQTTLHDLAPSSLEYYSKFCGPLPNSISYEDYLTETLPSHRQQLLRDDLVAGLEICLWGCLRDDLMPGPWTAFANDEEMWKAIHAIDTRANPFMLLGVLDIAIARQHDDRYRTLAEEIVATLLSNELIRPDGVDAYELLSIFADIALDRINTIEAGAVTEPLWKRLCAWMQAGLIMHSTLDIQINLTALSQLNISNKPIVSIYTRINDLRRAPMYVAGETSRRFLREEIIGRLDILTKRHEAAGRHVPLTEEIHEATKALGIQGSPLGWSMPGPLEGHLLPTNNSARTLPDKEATAILNELSKPPNLGIWPKLSYFSQYFNMGEQILERTCEVAQNIPISTQMLEEEHSILFSMSLMAAAHRHKNLARSISSGLLKIAPYASNAQHAVAILGTMLYAGAAFDDDEEWTLWIREQLLALSYTLPLGQCTAVLADHLEELRKSLPMSSPVCAPALAVLMAAN